MGAVDHVTTNWLFSDRKHNLVDMVDPIMDLVMTGLGWEPLAAGGRPRWDRWLPRQERLGQDDPAQEGGPPLAPSQTEND